MILRQHSTVILDLNTTRFGYHWHKHKLNINELNTWKYDIQTKHLIATNYMICTTESKSDKSVRTHYVLKRIRTALTLKDNHTDHIKNCYKCVQERQPYVVFYFITEH